MKGFTLILMENQETNINEVLQSLASDIEVVSSNLRAETSPERRRLLERILNYQHGMAEMLVGTKRFINGERGALDAARMNAFKLEDVLCSGPTN